MRITFLLPTKNISGGIRSTMVVANILQQRGHQVRVVYPLIPGSLSARRLDRRDLKRRALETMMNIKKGNRVEWLDLEAELVRVLRLEDSRIPTGDVIIATWWADAYVVDACGEAKGAKLHLIRHYEVWGGPEHLVNGAYELPLHKVVTSKWLKDMIEVKFGAYVHPPMGNGVEFGTFHLERDDLGAHEPPRIGMLYRRAPWKGMGDGFEVLRAVQARYPDIHPVIFGEPPLPADEQAMDGLRNVEFHKLPYGEKLRRIYNSLDIFLFPSHSEGYGVPPMEAMSCGAACVVTDVGGIPEYSRPGETALVYEPRDVGGMAAGIMALLADEGRRREIAAAGHEHIQAFTWERCVDILEGIIEEVTVPVSGEAAASGGYH